LEHQGLGFPVVKPQWDNDDHDVFLHAKATEFSAKAQQTASELSVRAQQTATELSAKVVVVQQGVGLVTEIHGVSRGVGGAGFGKKMMCSICLGPF